MAIRNCKFSIKYHIVSQLGWPHTRSWWQILLEDGDRCLENITLPGHFKADEVATFLLTLISVCHLNYGDRIQFYNGEPKHFRLNEEAEDAYRTAYMKYVEATAVSIGRTLIRK